MQKIVKKLIKTTTKTITNTKVAVAVLAVLAVGGIAFLLLPLWEEKRVADEFIDLQYLKCPGSSLAAGISGRHNWESITNIGLQCFGSNESPDGLIESGFVGDENPHQYISFGPDNCSGKLMTGFNLYPATGKVTRITKICGGDEGREENPRRGRVLNCNPGDALKGMTVELDQQKYITDIRDLDCVESPKEVISACYVNIPDTNSLVFLDSKHTLGNTCESIYLASKYNSGSDFYLLLSSLFPNHTEVLNNKENIINSKSQDRSVLFVNPDFSKQNFSYLDSKIYSNQCESIEYFGVPLFCFNEVKSNNKVYNDNLGPMIQYLTLLRSASTKLKVPNQLFNEQHFAYKFMVDHEVDFFDMTKHDLHGSTELEMCKGDQVAAFYSKKDQKRVYICKKMLNINPITPYNLVQNTGILYHEVNHKYPDSLHKYDKNCNIPVKKTQGEMMDKDFESTYGSHAIFLLTMSKDDHLPCKYRKRAWERAELIMYGGKNGDGKKLCAKNLKHNFQEPKCVE